MGAHRPRLMSKASPARHSLESAPAGRHDRLSRAADGGYYFRLGPHAGGRHGRHIRDRILRRPKTVMSQAMSSRRCHSASSVGDRGVGRLALVAQAARWRSSASKYPPQRRISSAPTCTPRPQGPSRPGPAMLRRMPGTDVRYWPACLTPSRSRGSRQGVAAVEPSPRRGRSSGRSARGIRPALLAGARRGQLVGEISNRRRRTG